MTAFKKIERLDFLTSKAQAGRWAKLLCSGFGPTRFSPSALPNIYDETPA